MSGSPKRFSRPFFAAIVLACAFAARPGQAAQILTGIDVLEADQFKELQGLRLGLITNQTGVDRDGRSTAEILAGAPGVTLAAVFCPEHGCAGQVENGPVSSGTVILDGRPIPVRSLYGEGRASFKPKPEDLRDLDALVFDMQDVGARFYTYLPTMGLALEAAKDAGIGFVVLDRPNPINGNAVQGAVLEDPRPDDLTAYYAIAVRHGMTAGEVALFKNASVQSQKLKVIKMESWSRDLWFDQTGLPWVPPSPNMPSLESAILYPGIGMFEASNLSVGRGTPSPFAWIGAPWIDGKQLLDAVGEKPVPGAVLSIQDETPAKSLYIGTPCHGLRVTVTERDNFDPIALFLKINRALMALYPKDFQWRWDEAEKMTGTKQFQVLCERGAAPEEIQKLFQAQAQAFKTAREPYLLYR